MRAGSKDRIDTHSEGGNGWLAALVGIGTAALLIFTTPAIGITWDEPAYITSAKTYAAWFPVLLRQPL